MKLSYKVSLLESRAMAWVEVERAKYMARFLNLPPKSETRSSCSQGKWTPHGTVVKCTYKREEVKIQAWENRQMRKAEMKMKKTEAKAERMKARAEEQMTRDIEAAQRAAEEKRANEEAKLNEKGTRTSERAEYIRRTGNLPVFLHFQASLFLPVKRSGIYFRF
ncbi:hypothetical protein MLD38_024880 [Melastoma candidum]|uniref:Uncharacterized protein n=1 Tax=Melastoma candidum TaxID=119954 RepID=A0ACB9NX44_9MYRT|nr:hypothetical protein MLD38_024880 [Melastoma candidum]